MTISAQKEAQKKLFIKLRIYEHNAYAALVAAYKAQGELTWQKKKILDKVRESLYVEPDRQTAELMRVEQDPLVQSIVKHDIHNKRANIFKLFTKTELHKTKDTSATTNRGYDTEDEPKHFGPPQPKRKKKTKADNRKRARPSRTSNDIYDSRPNKKVKTEATVTPAGPPVDHPVYALVQQVHNQEKDFTTVRSRDVLEEIGQQEYEQLVTLETKLKEYSNDTQLVQFLYEEVKRKMERMEQLVKYTEANPNIIDETTDANQQQTEQPQAPTATTSEAPPQAPTTTPNPTTDTNTTPAPANPSANPPANPPANPSANPPANPSANPTAPIV